MTSSFSICKNLFIYPNVALAVFSSDKVVHGCFDTQSDGERGKKPGYHLRKNFHCNLRWKKTVGRLLKAFPYGSLSVRYYHDPNEVFSYLSEQLPSFYT